MGKMKKFFLVQNLSTPVLLNNPPMDSDAQLAEVGQGELVFGF